MLGGSQTARRLAAQGDMDYVRPAMMAFGGHPVPAAIDLLRQASRTGAPAVDTNPVGTAVARQLFSTPGQEYFDALRRLQELKATPIVRVPLGATSSAVAAQPTPTQRRQTVSGLLGGSAPLTGQ